MVDRALEPFPRQRKRSSEDLTGRNYGRLTVIRRGPDTPTNAIRWLCQCSCGNTTLGRSGDLKSGDKQSCGCLLREQRRACQFIDMTGRTFGMLTVTGEAEKRFQNKATRWQCRCECGRSTTVFANDLRRTTRQGVQSCGCLVRLDLTGKKSGWLTAIKRVSTSRKRAAIWLCQCRCGKSKAISAYDFKSGRNVSCGCAVFGPRGAPLTSAEHRALRAVHAQARRARLKGGGGRFTPEQIEDVYVRQKGRCAEETCKVSLKRTGFHRDHWMPVRLNGSSDIRNIALLCPRCNRSKGWMHPVDWARRHNRLL
jgi:hypothetical protein